MDTTVNIHRIETTMPRPAPRLLQTTLIVDALTFLTAAALDFGARIPLGFVTLQFPFRVIPAGIGESVIGAALLLAGVTMRRSWAWIGFWLSVGGIAFGLAASARSRGPAFDVHVLMAALAAVLLTLLWWTSDTGQSRARPTFNPGGGLMLLAGLTLFGASAIHFGLTAPFVNDPFAGAAIPEAILGGIMLLGCTVLLTGLRGGWELALAAAVLTVLLTLYGFTVTLARGGLGDIAYHVTLLAMLFGSVGLLLVRRLARLTWR